jgi:hypothetical protein
VPSRTPTCLILEDRAEHAASPHIRTTARPESTVAEGLDGVQATEVGERLTSTMQREQPTFLQRLALEFPEHVRRNPTMSYEREAERVLSLGPRETGSRVQNTLETVTLRQLAWLSCDRRGDLPQLIACWQVMLKNHELPLQLHGNLDHWRDTTRNVRFCLPAAMAVSRAWTISAPLKKRWKFRSTSKAVPVG